MCPAVALPPSTPAVAPRSSATTASARRSSLLRRMTASQYVPVYRLYRSGFRKELFVDEGRFLSDDETQDLPNKDAAEVIKCRQEPVWGFFDFGPAGLVMANSLPTGRLERVALPSQAWLRRAANTPRGRQLLTAKARSSDLLCWLDRRN